MLKVVGASIVQTRVSSYILAALAICGIIIIIFGGNMGSIKDNDGIYSATVYWKNKAGYRMEFWGQGNALDEIPIGSARAYYKPDFYVNGWSKLEIETNVNDPDWVQAYSAGLLEGSLTWQLIYWHWQNTIQGTCEKYERECVQIREYIRINSESIRSRAIQLSDGDTYWHHVRLYYAQLDGLETGWRYAVKRSSKEKHYDIISEDFLWMNIAADLPDMIHKFSFSLDDIFKSKPNLGSALFKLTNISSDPAIHVSHSTAGMYSRMLRVIKRYQFNFHVNGLPNAKLVPGTNITFTGYPGVLSSQDDFYLINSKNKQHSLAVTGTPISNLKVHLWNKFNIEEQVLTCVRVMVANRLANNGRMWSRYFSHSNSGTDNKQWVVLNKHKLVKEPLKKKAEGLLWIIEQIPGLIHASDQSHILRKNDYWASFGIAFYEDIRQAVKLVDPEFDEGSQNSYTECPRAQLFSQCTTQCNSLENVLHTVRLGIHPANNEYGARCDLYSDYPLPYGVIDSKFFTGTAENILDFQIISGPVHSSDVDFETNEVDEMLNNKDVIPPFKWSSSKFKDAPHVGQPDIWKFTPFRPNWVWI